jgi:ABC-type lipoprotein export system ATPase subunit
LKQIKLSRLQPSFISGVETSPSPEIWFGELCFRKGETVLISASSGQGKSSLLSYIFGERNDYAGEIRFDDRDINTLKKSEWQKIRKTELSCVFQGLRLFNGLTVMENIHLKNRLTQHKTTQEIIHLLEVAGLADKIDEKAGRLSFGQQQRVATVRALCQPFDFILMDEPFSHLDETNIAILAELITREIAQKNAAMILCSLGYEYPFNYHKKLVISD